MARNYFTVEDLRLERQRPSAQNHEWVQTGQILYKTCRAHCKHFLRAELIEELCPGRRTVCWKNDFGLSKNRTVRTGRWRSCAITLDTWTGPAARGAESPLPCAISGKASVRPLRISRLRLSPDESVAAPLTQKRSALCCALHNGSFLPSAEELHDQVVRPDVIKLADVGMIQRGQGPIATSCETIAGNALPPVTVRSNRPLVLGVPSWTLS